ncbi:hypothetical protein [Endozoicomonas lisbonensis]|uniref:Uncharacterized protein n=1 Tax=Endozoicomonas lisbonensis TaxID=3120522 RepID=A0ABV2SCI6_9GAMM
MRSFPAQLVALVLILFISAASGSDRRYMLLKKPIPPEQGAGTPHDHVGEVTIDDDHHNLTLRINKAAGPIILELSYAPETMVVRLTNRSPVAHSLDAEVMPRTSWLSNTIISAGVRALVLQPGRPGAFEFSLHDILCSC